MQQLEHKSLLCIGVGSLLRGAARRRSGISLGGEKWKWGGDLCGIAATGIVPAGFNPVFPAFQCPLVPWAAPAWSHLFPSAHGFQLWMRSSGKNSFIANTSRVKYLPVLWVRFLQDFLKCFAGCDLSRELSHRFLKMIYRLKSSYQTTKILFWDSSPCFTRVVKGRMGALLLPLKPGDWFVGQEWEQSVWEVPR